VEVAVDQEGNESAFAIDASGPFSALSFKTTLDQFSGKLSFVKVMGGVLKSDSEFVIGRDGKKIKGGKIYTAIGQEALRR
jgi:elongation factor G